MTPAISLCAYRAARQERATAAQDSLLRLVASADSELLRVALVMAERRCTPEEAQTWLAANARRCAGCGADLPGRVALDLETGLAYCAYACGRFA